jgi:hypothetical protein
MTLRGRSQVTVVRDEKCRRNKQLRTGKGREELQSRNRGEFVTGAIRRLAPAISLSALAAVLLSVGLHVELHYPSQIDIS